MADTDPKSMLDNTPDDRLEAQLDAEAEAAYAAGRVVPHAAVIEWLKSWGTAEELPCPSPEST
jgi:predicted transcriptional regulator